VLIAVVFILLKDKATKVEGRDTYIFHAIVSEYTVHSKRYTYIVDFLLRRLCTSDHHLTYGIECVFFL